MAVPDERLVLEASVVDDFSSTLTDLSEALLEVDRLAAETVEDINADVNIDDALRDLATLGGAMEAVDDDVTIGTDVDGIEDVFDSDGNLQTPSTPDIEASGGGGATADGGGDDTSVLDPDEIADFRAAFGEAFDPSAIFSDRQPQRGVDLLEGRPEDFIDQDAALR